MSSRKLGTNNTSGFKGVSFNTKAGKWIARASLNGKRVHLGVFATADAAAAAYNRAESHFASQRRKYSRTDAHQSAITASLRTSNKAKAHVQTMNAAKKGVPLSEEHRHKIAEGQKGREVSESTRAKISQIHTGKLVSDETRARISASNIGKPKPTRGERHPFWKGDDVKYRGLHMWVARHKTRQNRCHRCNIPGKTHMANISGEYKRDVNDFIELCVSCHRNYDLKKITLKAVA